MTLISELKRRNIFRVAVLYIVAGWLLLQLADVMFSAMDAGWVYRFLFGILIICFPLILVFSYIFEITPEGLKKLSLIHI